MTKVNQLNLSIWLSALKNFSFYVQFEPKKPKNYLKLKSRQNILTIMVEKNQAAIFIYLFEISRQLRGSLGIVGLGVHESRHKNIYNERLNVYAFILGCFSARLSWIWTGKIAQMNDWMLQVHFPVFLNFGRFFRRLEFPLA